MTIGPPSRRTRASHRWFRLGVAARLLECALDEHDTLAPQVDAQLLDVTEARRRVAPGHFDRAGRKRALDELEFVGRSVDAVCLLQCVEPQGRSRRARSTAAMAESAAVPVAKLATCPRGLRRTLKLPGGGVLIAAVGSAGVARRRPATPQPHLRGSPRVPRRGRPSP